VIEIVDQEDKLRAFVETLSDVTGIGLITLQAIEVIGGGAAPVLASLTARQDVDVGQSQPAETSTEEDGR
jgi:hypothetical protein